MKSLRSWTSTSASTWAEPGQLCQSDFTHMSSLGVTMQRQPFEHMVYHFVLTYSNFRKLEPIESEGLYYSLMDKIDELSSLTDTWTDLCVLTQSGVNSPLCTMKSDENREFRILAATGRKRS